MSDGLPADFERCFREMVGLLRKTDSWWLVNVETDTNPAHDGYDIEIDAIQPGPVMAIQVLCDIALGDEEQSRFHYEQLRRLKDGS